MIRPTPYISQGPFLKSSGVQNRKVKPYLPNFASITRSHTHLSSSQADQNIVTTTSGGYAHDMNLLSGTWVKDRQASDSMGPAMDLMALGGVVRQAVKLVKGVKISQDDTTWTMAVFSIISWFKVTERYPLNGDSVECKRRDLRRGGHIGHLEPGKPGPHGGLLLQLSWQEPHGGTGTDEFVLAPAGTAAAQKESPATSNATPSSVLGSDAELHVYSNIVVDGRPCAYRTVYHRK